MWSEIIREFADSPSQNRVVRFLLENGFGVNEEGRITCNDVEIPSTHIAKVLDTDRRVVDATAHHILKTPSLHAIFTNMRATPDLRRVAGPLGLSVITIIPRDATQIGIVGAAVQVVTANKMNIRQIFVTDPQLSEEPRLVIITAEEISPAVIEGIRKLPQVKQLIL